jgi:hypothetical protein
VLATSGEVIEQLFWGIDELAYLYAARAVLRRSFAGNRKYGSRNAFLPNRWPIGCQPNRVGNCARKNFEIGKNPLRCPLALNFDQSVVREIWLVFWFFG